MLNILSVFIPGNERIITIEDTSELQLLQNNLVKMISTTQVDMDSLLVNALRMRPDRIIVGEVRGKEAVTLFTAMNTGHDGCMGTLHANTAKELVTRITNPPMNVPQNMLSALNLVVVMRRFPDGKRGVYEISEITGADKSAVRFNTIYKWDNANSAVASTGIPARMIAKISEESGLTLKDIDNKINRYKDLLDKATNDDLNSVIDTEYSL